MWKFICSACRAEFFDESETAAAQEFQAHALEAHNAQIVLTVTEAATA